MATSSDGIIAEKTEPVTMVKNLVLGCVQSWLNRYGREDIVKMVSDNFIDKEIFEGLKCLCNCLGLEDPKVRRNTAKQVAVKVWAAELYDYMMKEDNVGYQLLLCPHMSCKEYL